MCGFHGDCLKITDSHLLINQYDCLLFPTYSTPTHSMAATDVYRRSSHTTINGQTSIPGCFTMIISAYCMTVLQTAAHLLPMC